MPERTTTVAPSASGLVASGVTASCSPITRSWSASSPRTAPANVLTCCTSPSTSSVTTLCAPATATPPPATSRAPAVIATISGRLRRTG
ncbi:MAG TPA: hypothetical protein PKB06_04985, partial [Actinotalea sp.]|nr:hypothetical protein [Actinotalea sp.]